MPRSLSSIVGFSPVGILSGAGLFLLGAFGTYIGWSALVGSPAGSVLTSFGPIGQILLTLAGVVGAATGIVIAWMV